MGGIYYPDNEKSDPKPEEVEIECPICGKTCSEDDEICPHCRNKL